MKIIQHRSITDQFTDSTDLIINLLTVQIFCCFCFNLNG